MKITVTSANLERHGSLKRCGESLTSGRVVRGQVFGAKDGDLWRTVDRRRRFFVLFICVKKQNSYIFTAWGGLLANLDCNFQSQAGLTSVNCEDKCFGRKMENFGGRQWQGEHLLQYKYKYHPLTFLAVRFVSLDIWTYTRLSPIACHTYYIFHMTWWQILYTMRLQCVSKILTPRRMLQKTWLIA